MLSKQLLREGTSIGANTRFIDASYEYLINDCEELCKILGSIVKTTKTKL